MAGKLRFLSTVVVLLGAGIVGAVPASAVPVDRNSSVVSSAASPLVSGPVVGGLGGTVLPGTTTFDLGRVGYTQSEYFVSGLADAYQPVAPLGADGHWQVKVAAKAPYTTRLVVYRPADPVRFNGTVVVEWLNVTGSADAAAEWMASHTEMIRRGYAWVGVSAQSAGVLSNKLLDPVRYLPLVHPGDSFSYDIYSQAGRAVRASAAKVLGGLRPARVLAEGESQSAFRLTTYINAVHSLARVYDGYFVHSRGGGSAPLSQAPQADTKTPAVVHFRDDLDVPVLAVQTETDLVSLGYAADRQADSRRFRLWEVAGTAHADHYTVDIGFEDDGSGAADVQEFEAMRNPPTTAARGVVTCDKPVNTGQQNYVLNAAQRALNSWVATGQAPPPAPRLELDSSTSPPSFLLDGNSNARGGIRTPSVDVPVATLSGLGQSSGGLCFLFGTTVPFNAEKIASLYPSHAQFVAQWSSSAAAAARAGFLLDEDVRKLVAAADASSVGN